MSQQLVLLMALFSLSTSPLWVRLADAHLVAIGAWRLLGASALTLGWLYFRESEFRSTILKSIRSPWVWLTGVLFFLHLWTFMEAVQKTSISHMALIFASNPIFTAVGALVFFQEKFHRKLFLVYGLALTGLYFLFRDQGDQASTVYGDCAALISAVLHAAYVLSGKRSRRDMGNLQFTSLVYLSSGIMFLILAFALNAPLAISSQNTWWALIGLIIFPTLLGHSLFNYLLNSMNINFLSCAKLIEPGLATLMAYWLVGELISSSSFWAYGFIASAVLILFWPKGRSPVHIVKNKETMKT